jgi:hypothetical protein
MRHLGERQHAQQQQQQMQQQHQHPANPLLQPRVVGHVPVPQWPIGGISDVALYQPQTSHMWGHHTGGASGANGGAAPDKTHWV